MVAQIKSPIVKECREPIEAHQEHKCHQLLHGDLLSCSELGVT